MLDEQAVGFGIFFWLVGLWKGTPPRLFEIHAPIAMQWILHTAGWVAGQVGGGHSQEWVFHIRVSALV